METLKQSVVELFFPEDEISCPGMPTAYRVIVVDPERVQLRALATGTDETAFDYVELAAALAAMDTADGAQIATPLQCFASHLLIRHQQAARDKEVDAMWRTAMTCQL